MVHAGGVHQDQEAMVLIPMVISISTACQRPPNYGKTYLSIRVTDMGGPVIRLAWCRCRNNWVDITQPIALMDFLLSWISFPFPFTLSFPISVSFSFSVSFSVPLALLSHPLVIDIPLALALMVRFHRRPPTLWWRPTS